VYKGLPVVDSRTIKVAVHALLRRWSVVVWICRENHIPAPVDVVNLRRPDVGRVGFSWRWEEEKLGVGIIPIADENTISLC